jgi:hypothetical protein
LTKPLVRDDNDVGDGANVARERHASDFDAGA